MPENELKTVPAKTLAQLMEKSRVLRAQAAKLVSDMEELDKLITEAVTHDESEAREKRSNAGK